MPQRQLGPEGTRRGGLSCDWLMCCGILSESIYCCCLLTPEGGRGGGGGGGGLTHENTCMFTAAERDVLKITRFDLRFIHSYLSHVCEAPG